jgi:hypothetical protein
LVVGILTVTVGGIPKIATVLPVLLKLFTVPCNDRGHINVMLVLQSCTDCLQITAGSSTDTFPTPSDCTYGVGNMEVEEDVIVIEESFIAVNRHSIKQETIPEDITFPDIKSEPDEVSYVCVCLLLDTLKYVLFLMSPFLACCTSSTIGNENAFGVFGLVRRVDVVGQFVLVGLVCI